MIIPPLEPPWPGDYNGGIIIALAITIIITNLSSLFCVTSSLRYATLHLSIFQVIIKNNSNDSTDSNDTTTKKTVSARLDYWRWYHSSNRNGNNNSLAALRAYSSIVNIANIHTCIQYILMILIHHQSLLMTAASLRSATTTTTSS